MTYREGVAVPPGVAAWQWRPGAPGEQGTPPPSAAISAVDSGLLEKPRVPAKLGTPPVNGREKGVWDWRLVGEKLVCEKGVLVGAVLMTAVLMTAILAALLTAVLTAISAAVLCGDWCRKPVFDVVVEEIVVLWNP